MKKHKIVQVAVEKTTAAFDTLFSYVLPEELEQEAQMGCRVVVPFGRSNKKIQGLIFSIEEENFMMTDDYLKGLKPVFSVIDRIPVVNDEMFRMIDFMRETTFCTYYDAVKTMLPPGLNVAITPRYSVIKGIENIDLTQFSQHEKNIISCLQAVKTKAEIDLILTTGLTSQKKLAVTMLEQRGLIKAETKLKQAIGEQTIKLIRLADHYELMLKRITANQRSVVEFLKENGTAEIKEASYLCGVSEAIIRNLIKNGVVRSFEKGVMRTPYVNGQITQSLSDIVLTEEQQCVFYGISKEYNQQKANVSLLLGITGSGKTQVFLKLIEKTINDHKQAIMLVPEIALTPQMVGKFQSLFGQNVAVLHSSLSLGERLDEWRRIKNGEAKIVVGTRSAVFAPLDNIGLIIMDEEGEWSYKSETNPRYHAREIAKLRCVHHNATLLLASATPSVDSYYKAEKGTYQLFELENRYGEAKLPNVAIVDLRGNKRTNSSLSDLMVDEIYYNLGKKEQTILLLNRRGYNTFAACMQCGVSVSCPNCSVALTYHKANGFMMCHYCGYTERLRKKCTECGSEFIKLNGQGTQRLEDELFELFPKARVLRMDADTTYSRLSYEKNFESFAAGEYDILIGTQMIAKGLDFPNVTLVGALNVDGSLYSTDFRANEKTFSLITQVIGRGGRAKKAGRAFIQTLDPDNFVVNLAANQNYKDFYKDEISARKALLYPPFCDICVIGVSGENDQTTKQAASDLICLLEKYAMKFEKLPLRVLGPVAANVLKVNNKFRYRIVIKCRANKDFRDLIRMVFKGFNNIKQYNKISIYADINGE